MVVLLPRFRPQWPPPPPPDCPAADFAHERPLQHAMIGAAKPPVPILAVSCRLAGWWAGWQSGGGCACACAAPCAASPAVDPLPQLAWRQRAVPGRSSPLLALPAWLPAI